MSNPFAKYLEAVQRQDALFGTKLSRQSASVYDDYTPPEDTIKPTKTLDNYIGDTAVDVTKAAMTLAQTGISAIDLGAYAAEGLIGIARGIGSTVAPNYVAPPDIQEYGQFSKLLDDYAGINIGKAKQTLGELGYSDIRKAQEQELHTGYTQEQIDAFNNEWANQYNLQYQDLANKGANALQLEGFKAKFNDDYKKAYTAFMDKNQTSWDKSLGENLSIMGKAFGTVLDNPSLGVGAAIESTGYLLPSLAVSRGVAALQGAAKASAAERAIAAGIGEGSVSALALNEQMRGNSETGTIDGNKVAAGFGGGAFTGLIGGISNKLGSRFGLDDVDSLSLGTQAKGFSVTRPVLATGQEAGEEFVQGIGETVIPNIAEGNDPLQGLAQELALGTVAGGIMGGATNARSLVSGAGSDLAAGFSKVAEAIGKGKDAITAKTFEEFNDPTNKGYDPAKAFNSQVPDLSSADETVRTKAQENIDSVFTNLEQHTNSLINEKVTAEGILKNIAALPVEEQAQHAQAKKQAEKAIKSLEERIILADNQLMDLFEQKLNLGKNQEVQAGIPQYSEEQAKADIEVLSQAPTSTAVWTTEDNNGNALNIPVTITGTPVVSNGYETVEVKYTDSTGKERTTYAPTSALVQDTTTQQEAAQRITKHFSKLSLDELDTVAKSPYLSEEQRNSLRYLSQAKRAIADLASPSDVTNHIMNGLKGNTPMESHRGLNTYTDMVNAAINTKDEKLLNLALNDLGRFAQDHTDKANALTQANELVTSGKFSKVQVLRSNDGTWGIVTDPNKFVDDIKLKATAGWNVTVHSNKKGAIDLVTKEATLIQDNLKALTQVGLSFGLQAVEPTVTPPTTVEAIREANKPVTTSTQSTADITSAVARLNGFMGNTADTTIKVNAVTPALLNQIEAKVVDAFDIGMVSQQTYDGVNKDINTLRQYLTNAATTTPNQEVSTPATSTQEEPTQVNNAGFQGYKGGFEDKGKGTPQGDGKDKAMREVADGFIGEISGFARRSPNAESGKGSSFFPNESTSTATSLITIQNKKSLNDPAKNNPKIFSGKLYLYEVDNRNEQWGIDPIPKTTIPVKQKDGEIKNEQAWGRTYTSVNEHYQKEIDYKAIEEYQAAIEDYKQRGEDYSFLEEFIQGELNAEPSYKSVKIIMLARNSEFKGKGLTAQTKKAILDAHKKGAEFVVGDMPGVDSQFIDYLQEIGAKFTIYHTGNTPRIKISKPTTPTQAEVTETAIPTNTPKNNSKETQTGATEAVNTEPQADTTTPVEAATPQPESEVESDEATQSEQSVENQAENKDKTQTEEATTVEDITQFVFERNTHTLATRLIDQWHKAQDVFEDLLKVTSSNLTPSHVSVLTERLKALIPVQPETWIRFVNVVDSGEGVPESILTKGGNTRLDINGIPIILVNLHNPVPEMDLLETTTHEYVHAVTAKWLNDNPNSIEAQRLQQVIDALGEYLKTTEGLDAETIKRATQAQKNIREVIAFGLTNEKVMNVIDTLLIEDMQNDTFEQSNEGTREQAVGGRREVLESSETRQESNNTGRSGNSEKSTEKSPKTGRQVLEEVLQVIVESTLSRANQAEVEDGTITVLQGVTEEVRQEERNKPFSLRNLIKAYFTQKKADASNSPLVLVKDFTSNLNVASALSEYLSIDTKVNTKQKAQVEHFQKFAKNLAPVITRVFQGEFSKDPKNNLVRDLAVDGVLDENILTAIAVAAYGYLIRYSEPYNTDDNIRDIVRITKDDTIPPQVAQLLRYAGQEAPYVESDLGKEIAKLLGLKALDDSSADLQSRLEKALGSLTTAALNDVGYVSVDSTSINPKAIGYLMRNAGYTGNEATGIDDGLEGSENLHALETLGKLTFIRVNYVVDDKAPVIAISKAAKIDPVKVLRPARNKDGLIIIKPLVWGTDLNKTSPNDLNDILKNSEETKGILDKVFNNDVGYIKPLLVEPEALDVKTKQGTNNSISKTQKELVEEGQKTAFSIRANTVNVLRTLKGLTEDSKLLKQLLGIWVDDDVIARTHITDRESLEAKTKNEWRTLINGLEWADMTSLGNDEYAEFYDAQYITQNERMQYLSNLFNMQGSQIHRAMASLSAFKLEIDLTDTSSANENYQRFLQAVGEGLEGLDDYLAADIKSKSKWYQFFTTDKVKGEVYTEALQRHFASDLDVLKAIDAMESVLRGNTPTEQQQTDIALFVKRGGMGIQSLQSLIALAEMQVAVLDGKTSFTTTIGLGSDGVNNGVASANILTGVITREMKQQVGMLPKKSTEYDPVPFTNMQEVYAEGKPDYYISFGAVMGRFLGLLRTKDTANNKQWRDSVQALFPLYKAIEEASIEMRKIAKTWSIPFNYGAGKKSLQRALARGFMAGIYKDMNKIANKAIDLNTALTEKDITKEVFDIEMAALRLTAATLQENINNILKRGWSETIDKANRTTWKTTYRIQFPKDLTKLNDYNFDEAQIGQVYFDREGNRQVSFDSTVATNVSEGIVYSLTQAVTALHGKAAWQATEDYAFEYTRVRDLLNTVHTATYMLYENMRTDLIQAKLREKREKVIGTIEKRNAEMEASNNALINEYKLKGKDAVRNAQADERWQKTTPVKDLVKEFEYLGLTTEELREIDNILKPIAPVLHSALSRETNDLNAGITLTTTDDKVAKASDNKQVATSYIDKYRGKPRHNTSGLSFKVQMASGIKALAMAVQGVDAYVAAYLQAKFPTLNVHDAGIFGLGYFVEATKYQNEIYLQAMVNYHLNTESVEALMRSYLGLKDFIASLDGLGLDEIAKAKFIKQVEIVEDNILNRVAERNPDGTVKTRLYIEKDGGSYDEEIRKGIFKGLNKTLKTFGVMPKDNIIEALQVLILIAVVQDMNKLKSLKDLKSVHQYSGDGGAFIIGGKGSDLSEAEHLRRIEAQEELLEVKRRTLLQQLEREGVALDLVLGKKTRGSSLLNFLTTNKDKEVDVKDIVTILRGDSSLTRSTAEFDRQLAILDGLDGLLDGVKVIYKDVESTDGITDYVRGYYDSDTNTITLRANAKYPANPVLVLHELLHSGLAARLETLRKVPKTNEKDYILARKALDRLEALRQEVLSRLVEGVDASKYFELKAAFEKAGGWDTYKEVQKKLKEAKDSAYEARNIMIKTHKELRLKAYEELNAQKAELQAAKNLEEEALNGLRASKFGSLEYETARLQQQAALAAIKEIKQELQQKYENIARINTKLDTLYASNLTDELNSDDIARVELSKKFLTLHSALKNTMFTIEGGTEITALTMVERLESVDEFISYGLTEQPVQDILQNIDVVNTAERKQVSALRGMWGKFVKAVSALFVRPSAEVVPALSAFILDTADLLRSIRNEDVPRLPVEPTTRLFSTSADGQVNQMSSIEVMQSLPHTGNTDFGLHLNRLAETVIGQLYNNDEVAKAQIDVIQAIQVAPAIKAGFNLSQREAAVQRSLELVLETYTLNTAGGANASQLWKIYKEAQKNIKVENLYDGDWAAATPQERAATHQKFKYLFADNLKGTEALARFVSMVLASEEVHSLLGFNTVTAKPSKQKSWFDTVNAWAQYVFAWMGNKLVRTSANDPAYKQLQSLVNNLVALDIRNRQDTVALYEKAWNLVGKVTEPLDKAAQSLRQYATNRDFLRNSKYLPLRTLGSIAALDAKAMGETIPKLIRETRDKARPNEKLGEAMNALMESTAMTQIRKAMEALIRQANLNAKERQDRTDNVKKAIMSWFKDGGKHITKEQHKAITYTLLRTDAQSLLTTFGLNKTIGLLLDTDKLKNEIDLVTKDISQYSNGNSMINQSMRLAYYMVTNKGGLGLSKNPTAIAMGLGTNYQIDLENVDQALVGQLDVLVSLYAMKYTSAKDRKVLGDMYTENPEALEGLLQMHKGFMTDAATEFKDNPLSYTKGWMPEIVNPYREVKVVNNFVKEQMLKEGWKLIEEIKPQGSFLMVHPDIGYQRLVSGAVDLQNSHRKGTEIVNRTSRNYLDTVRANLAYTAHIASIPHTQFDPSKQETGLIPAYDTDGVPMGFNYEMASWVRDKEMERNNNFADLMGTYAGAMFYKPAKRNQSVTVANVLFEDYKQNYQKNPNSYIKLSGKSSDPKIVEMWRMLPKDFRQRATELYGKGEPIIINNEAFLLAFGFKKWTITSIWDKPADQRTKIETMFVTMAEGILGDTAKARIAKGGHIWTEAVSKAKDFIVIRSISVLWNNVLANGLMLMAYGINPVSIAKDWAFITANVRSYQKLHSELIQLKANTLAGKGNDATERQINAIQRQLEANPMNKYINEGLLSSIVEDVTIQQGDYSYDSELKKKIDGVTGWLPDSVKTIGAWAVLNPSTQGYQFLATTTQLSDFVAKVTLAKHLESKGMDFKAAVSEASQTFINYDVPQGVGMQYMNDMGLFMFTKFFLRIQAVLLKLMDKKAATVLAQHIAVEGLTDMQGILDPMALTRVGNWPFEEGAFSIVGASMSIAPINTAF